MKSIQLYCLAVLGLVSGVLPACSNALVKVTPVTTPSSYPKVIEKAGRSHRYMVMQSGINLYTVKSVDVDRPKNEMTVTLDKVDSSRLAIISNAVDNRIKTQKGEPRISSQVHVYMIDSTSYTLDEPHTIPMSKVARVASIK